MERKFVITIGRQLGSGGKRVGEMLSKQLNIPCYDKELIRLASKESGLCKEFFEKADEKSGFSFIGNLFGISPLGGDVYADNYLRNESLFKIQSDVIRELAERQSCIFVGRCADYILRDYPLLFNVFISANIEDRIKRVDFPEKFSKEKITQMLEQADKKRAAYYNYYSNKTWGMAASYDLCINSSVLGIEETVAYIRHFAEKKFDFT